MAVLTQPRIIAQERFDLSDLKVLLESSSADWQFFVQGFLAPTQYVVNGFEVGAVGTPSPAQITLAGSTLINSNADGEFSFFVGPDAASPLSATLVSNSRNFLELQLVTEDGTPLPKNFWDQSADNGVGAEFIQTINTVTDLVCQVNVNQSGFTGSNNTLPLAVVDTDSGNNIKLILDRRVLFNRLGNPVNSQAGYAWSTQVEPPITLTMSGVSGTFVAGETVTFGSGATATVQSGGTSPITVYNPSSTGISVGTTVTGGTSAAVGTLATAAESFDGADRSLKNFRDVFAALMTEIRAIKGTPYWFSPVNGSVTGLAKYINSVIVPFTSSATFGWDGSNLAISDGNGSPSLTDILAKIRLFGTTQQLSLERADGTASSSKIAIADNQVLFVQLPATGDRAFSGNGAGSTNYQVAARTAFVPSDTNYWLAYREGNSLFIRNGQRLDAGTTVPIGAASGSGSLTQVTFVDPTSTTLPAGASLTVDGVAAANGDTVLFTNLGSGNNEIYKIAGVGTSITWTAQNSFNGSVTPSSGATVIATKGTSFAAQIGRYNGNTTAWEFNKTVRHFNGADYWEESALISSTLTNNASGDIFTVTASGSENIIIDFSILRGTVKETGTMWITQNGTVVDFSTGGSFTGATGVSFSASIATGTLHVSYTLDNSGSNATFKYSTKRWSDSSGGPAGMPSYTQSVQMLSGVDAIVGSSAQVSAGLATYSTIAAAIAASSAGWKILLLSNTYTENVTLTGTVTLEGKGFNTVINGTVTAGAGASGCVLRLTKITGNITFNSGSNANLVSDCWQNTAASITDNGTHNTHVLNGY